MVFTVGEAIWSPRLMQFSAEIAPRGKEAGIYFIGDLALFVGKALAGGMSGFLLETYTPKGAESFCWSRKCLVVDRFYGAAHTDRYDCLPASYLPVLNRQLLMSARNKLTKPWVSAKTQLLLRAIGKAVQLSACLH